jgi:hypothetical protein
MKITKRQLRRIIREAVETGYKGIPYLEGSYEDNGTVPYAEWKALVPAMEEIGSPMYGPALGIIAGTLQDPSVRVPSPLPYIPFIYAENVLSDLQAQLESGTVPPELLTKEMIHSARLASSDRDNEYVDAYDIEW